MDELANISNFIVETTQFNMPFLLACIGILFAINLLNSFIGYRLNYLGLVPRSIPGLLGIFTSPFLHGGFDHVFFNMIPFFVLANFVLLGGQLFFIHITVSIAIISGTLTWLFGRRALHVGSSSVIMGYFGYLLVNAYFHPGLLSIALAIVVLYYFGAMIFSILPTDEATSWEGHFFGLIAGIATSFLYPFVFNT